MILDTSWSVQSTNMILGAYYVDNMHKLAWVISTRYLSTNNSRARAGGGRGCKRQLISTESSHSFTFGFGRLNVW
jgi:hypothetical protein